MLFTKSAGQHRSFDGFTLLQNRRTTLDLFAVHTSEDLLSTHTHSGLGRLRKNRKMRVEPPCKWLPKTWVSVCFYLPPQTATRSNEAWLRIRAVFSCISAWCLSDVRRPCLSRWFELHFNALWSSQTNNLRVNHDARESTLVFQFIVLLAHIHVCNGVIVIVMLWPLGDYGAKCYILH